MSGCIPSGAPAAFHPVTCPACRGTSRLREPELLRMPYTIVFRCAYCRAVAVVDGSGRPAARPGPGARAT